MSEPLAKERPTVDLDDFERRLRPQDDHYEDPLAELARLVGETHDPYGDVFAHEAAAHPVPPMPGYPHAQRQERPFGVPDQMSPRLSGDFAAIEAGLRGALSAHPTTDLHDAPDGHEYYVQHDQYTQHDGAYLQDHEDPQWAAPPQQRAASSRSRRPIYAMVATIAVGVIGVGVAFAYKGASSSPSQIRTIAAAAGPTKIQPPVDATSDQGNHDSTILGGSGQPAPTQLVNNEEAPVDVSQTVQQNASRNPDAGPGQGDASSVPVPPSPSQANNGSAPQDPSNVATSPDPAPTFGMAGMPEPKKVKVVSVRPDGTILPDPISPIASVPATTSDTSDVSAPVSDQPTAKPSTPKTSTPKTTTSKTSTSKTAKPKTTSRIAAKPAVSPDDADDVPAPKPSRKTKPQRIASADPSPTSDINPTSAPNPAVDPSADAGGTPVAKPTGGFAVQLAAPGSESEARSASSRLARKFASALDGRHLGFHRALSNGKSVFRVRVSSLTKEDAVSLCEKLKADGGTCFVAKNN